MRVSSKKQRDILPGARLTAFAILVAHRYTTLNTNPIFKVMVQAMVMRRDGGGVGFGDRAVVMGDKGATLLR